MHKLFNKICVPFDFSEQSTKAIENAIIMAKHYQCSVHLLHVVTFSSLAVAAMPSGHIFATPDIVDFKEQYERKLDAILDKLNVKNECGICIDSTVQTGAWDEAIIEFVTTHKIDLVLIGQVGLTLKRRKMKLNPDLIAERANVAVVTIPSNRKLVKMGSIVIPITNFLPVRKLMYGIYLAINFDSTIRLLGIENPETSEVVHYYIKKSYQLIRDNCFLKVETDIIIGRNVAEALNQFSVKNMADLIIVNPGAQTRMPGFFSSLLGNVIQKYSAPPVLSISPL